MIFGAAFQFRAVDEARSGDGEGRNQAEVARDAVTASTTLAEPIWGTNGTVKPKWEPRGIAHRGVARGQIGMHGRRRLHTKRRSTR